LTIASILLRPNHLRVDPAHSIASFTDIEKETFPRFQNVLVNAQPGCNLVALTATKGQEFCSCALCLILVEGIGDSNGRIASFGSRLTGIAQAAKLLEMMDISDIGVSLTDQRMHPVGRQLRG